VPALRRPELDRGDRDRSAVVTPEPVRLTDYGRLLLGRVPWSFTIEVVLRIAVIYLILVVAMRLMGKRMASLTTRNELAALVALAGGIGPAIQDPKQGLLPPMIVCSVIVGIQRTIAVLTKNHGRFERATQGSMSTLVTGGTLDMGALRDVALSRQRVIAYLRSEGITSLGAVDRLYLEINGSFTVVRADEPRPGLSLVPPWDEDFRREQRAADGAIVCSRCGYVADKDERRERRCDECGSWSWEAPVL
jgi:uncharacterized membrane protein YcaP (DUF421 family)